MSGGMSAPRVGSLFTGYAGLDLAVTDVYGGHMVWYSEIEPGPLKVLSHRFPDVPNLGDVTAVDWASVEPVEILTGGSPCQDLSDAGRRAGMTEGTRSNLWVAMREAIAALRPKLVIWENVRGAYSATAASAMEPCPGCVGDGSGVYLRALGRVLGDLASLGYDARWCGLPASVVGAPHRRLRVFVVATDASRTGLSTGGSRGGEAPHGDIRHGNTEHGPLLPTPRCASGMTNPLRTPEAIGNPRGRLEDQIALLPTPMVNDARHGVGRAEDRRRSGRQVQLPHALLPTPTASEPGGTPEQYRERWAKSDGRDSGFLPLALVVTDRLLPTPQAHDANGGKTPEQVAAMRTRSGAGVANLSEVVVNDLGLRLLPTPVGADARNSRQSTAPNPRDHHDTLSDVAHKASWGEYAPAIALWERILGRPAPAPTVTSTKGNPQLSPVFVEWMMGLPEGWVTDVPGITRPEAIKALGNGVVSQQAAAALRWMNDWPAI